MHFLQNYWKGYQDKQKPLSSLWATSVLFFFLSFFFSILKVVWAGRLLRQDTPLRRWPLAGIQVEDMEKFGVHGTFAMAETFPAKLSQGTWCQPRGSWQAWWHSRQPLRLGPCRPLYLLRIGFLHSFVRASILLLSLK